MNATTHIVPEFSESMAEADGFRIRYREAGTGEAVIALHGAGGLRLSGMHEILSASYRVIAVEIPGFGESATNTRSASLDELAHSILAFTRAIGLSKFHLLGNSFGARLAAWMALHAPDTVTSLVLLAPATIRLGPIPQMRTPAEAAALMYAHPERQTPRGAPPSKEVAEKQQALVARLIGPPRDPVLEDRLRTLNVPVLALFGTKDRIAPTDAAHLYREILPNCHTIFIYDTAHALDAERPEAVASVIADFLARQEKFLVNNEDALRHP